MRPTLIFAANRMPDAPFQDSSGEQGGEGIWGFIIIIVSDFIFIVFRKGVGGCFDLATVFSATSFHGRLNGQKSFFLLLFFYSIRVASLYNSLGASIIQTET